MKYTAILFFIFWMNHFGISQDNIYSKDFIAGIMQKANNYVSNNPSMISSNPWISSTYYSGLMAAYHATGNQNYLNQCLDWGAKLKWRVANVSNNVYGSGFYSLGPSQIWLDCYLETGHDYMLEPTISYLNNPAQPNPVSDPLKWYYEKSGLRFVDGLYTSPPAFAMLNKITGEEKYLDWMDACVWDVYGVLFDDEEGLFYRDCRYKKDYQGEIEERYIRPDSIPHEEARKSFIYQETKNGKKVLWSRGNGWAFGGITRILKFLPPEHGNYDRYKALFVRMANELKDRQQADGFWRPNLDDPYDYDLKESSGTGFFTYGIAWGINNGVLSRDEFLPVVEKSWAALVSIVSEEGKVQWGQRPSGAPYKVIQDDTSIYVSGMFLLAASEMYKMN